MLLKHCPHILSGREIFLLTLFYLRHKPRYRLVGTHYGVSHTTVSRVIRHAFPILSSTFCSIQMPQNWDQIKIGINGAQFAIDATPHYRNRVHPGQREWYRSDKGGHMALSQVMVSLEGRIFSIFFAKGHNNDQGVFNLTVKDWIEEHNIVGIADRGYSHSHLVTPEDLPEETRWIQASQRSIVEIMIGMCKNWEFASGRVCLSPEMQCMGLKIVYEIVNSLIIQFPRVIK